ncbi:MAG: hypothetical protein AAFQ37_14660 [Bacteroidota bacterium]
MPTIQQLDTLSTKSLETRKRFSNLALLCVWIGAGIAFLALLFSLSVTGTFHFTLFVTICLALLASLPVYIEKKRILAILEKR